MKIRVWRFFAYSLVILIGIAVALPSFLPRDVTRSLPGFLPVTPVSLGLDLRGGASLTLRADEATLTAEILSDARDALSEALADNALQASIEIEGQTLVATAGNSDQIRPVLETATPTFQRSALGRAEPAFTFGETNGGGLTLTLREAAVEVARSLYTSVTALAAMLPMAIWGGAAVQSFAIPMVFGIVIAAGSAVFIAAPILLFLGDWRARKKTMQPASTASQTTV